jgi:hypothetical protein
VKKLLFLCALTLGACNGDSSNDGGTDATAEPAVDLCDINAFTGNGNACPRASTRVCFADPTCEAGNGCTCKDQGGTPKWSCYTPPECTGGCSPIADGGCDAAADAPAEAADDSGDAGTDGD